MDKQLEKINNKKSGPGRPRQNIKKVHLPNIVIYEDTVKEMEIIADETDRSQSAAYQEALDLYILGIKRRKNLVSL